MDNRKEVNIDAVAAEAQAGLSDDSTTTKVGADQLRNIYPEEDPRKFNTHYTEQEAVEYASKDHAQPITGVNSADQARIHVAREVLTGEFLKDRNISAHTMQRKMNPDDGRVIGEEQRMNEALAEKKYPKLQPWAVFLQVFLTVACLFFVKVPAFMMAMAFVAGVLVMPNYRLLGKKFPRLGFNPLVPFLVVDILLMLAGFMLLVGQIF